MLTSGWEMRDPRGMRADESLERKPHREKNIKTGAQNHTHKKFIVIVSGGRRLT